MITTCPNPLLLRELAQQEAEFHATRVRRLVVACLVTILWAVLSMSTLSIGSAVFVVLGTALTRTSSKRSVRRKVSEAAEDSRTRIPATNPMAPSGTPGDKSLPAPSGSRTPLQGTAPCSSPLQVHDASRIGQGQYQALPTMGTAMAAGPNGAATSKQQLTRLSSPLTPPTQLVTTPQELQHFLDTEEERAAHDRALSGQILNPFASLQGTWRGEEQSPGEGSRKKKMVHGLAVFECESPLTHPVGVKEKYNNQLHHLHFWIKRERNTHTHKNRTYGPP